MLEDLMIENEPRRKYHREWKDHVIPAGAPQSRIYLLNASATDCVYRKTASGMCYRIFMF
jgi:hypothetical protein